MSELGDPTSYLQLPSGVPVVSSDGEPVGSVEHVLADEELDIFDGLVVDAGDGAGGHRFVDVEHVEELHEHGVVLSLTAAEAADLPEPSANPAALSTDPDDTLSDTLGDKLRRAWEYVSGNY